MGDPGKIIWIKLESAIIWSRGVDLHQKYVGPDQVLMNVRICHNLGHNRWLTGLKNIAKLYYIHVFNSLLYLGCQIFCHNLGHNRWLTGLKNIAKLYRGIYITF